MVDITPVPIRALLIEDRDLDAQVVRGMLARSHLAVDVCWVSGLVGGLARLASDPFDVLLLDLGLADAVGLEGVHAVRRRFVDLPIVVLSGDDNPEVGLGAVRAGADDFVVKGLYDGDVLGRTVRYAIERRRATRRIRVLNANLERRVQARTRALRQANEDLAFANEEMSAFAQTATHDLRAPLRAIQGFASILEDDFAEVLGADGRGYLGRVSAACERMDILLEALRMLAGVSRSAMRPGSCDLGPMARRILADLAHAEPDREVAIEVDPSLRAMGDAGLIDLLLSNLLGNAWKFTRHRAAARIALRRVGEEGGVALFCVEDDGAGFDMAQAGSIFKPFERAHGEHEFEGTGLGLATAQRVVRRHGGFIRAEGTPGQGARFYFTLAPPLRPRGEPLVAGAAEPSPDELSPDELSPDELSPDELSPDELSLDELSLDELSLDEPPPTQPAADGTEGAPGETLDS